MSTYNKICEIVKPKQIYSMDILNFRVAFGQALEQELLHCPLSLQPVFWSFISPVTKYSNNLWAQEQQKMEHSSEKDGCSTGISRNKLVEYWCYLALLRTRAGSQLNSDLAGSIWGQTPLPLMPCALQKDPMKVQDMWHCAPYTHQFSRIW